MLLGAILGRALLAIAQTFLTIDMTAAGVTAAGVTANIKCVAAAEVVINAS